MRTIKSSLNATSISTSYSKTICYTILMIAIFILTSHSTPLGLSAKTQIPVYDAKFVDIDQLVSDENDTTYKSEGKHSISANWPLGVWGTHLVLHSNISMTSISSFQTGIGFSLQLPLELQPWNLPTWIKFFYDTKTSNQNTFENWKDISIPTSSISNVSNNWTYINFAITGRTHTIPYLQSGFSSSWLLGIEIPSKKQYSDQIYVGQFTGFYRWSDWGVSLPSSLRLPKFQRLGNDINISTGLAVQKFFNTDWNIQIGITYNNEIYEISKDTTLNEVAIFYRPNQISGTLELRYNLRDLTSADPDLDQIETSVDCCPFIAEDYDGFNDEDGCPDYDNDGDGIKDEFDKCPFNAEDFDLFEDEDGCPEVDNDMDQIFDSKDACPLAPEDYDNFEDFDGCPEFDNDKDSIPDVLDNCIFIPEDHDNFEDFDGCPEFDNDKDGIVDSIDKCPLLSEDYDNFEDSDGCPEFDNDQDGILDNQDYCPSIKENFNGFADKDGCPDILKLKDTLYKKTIYFNQDKSNAEELILLDDIENIIKIKDSFPNAYIQLTSRASEEGESMYNLNLSRKRSRSIRNILVARTGWRRQFIYSVFLGEEQPLSSIGSQFSDFFESDSFLEKNRRTDILIIKK